MNSPSICLKGIKNIIFDLGRVLLDIDPLKTQQGFANLGFKPSVNDNNVVIDIERGAITPEAFVNAVLASVNTGISAKEVIKAWNDMLLEFPAHRVEMLQRLKKDYKIYLLSNSNKIHYDYYASQFEVMHGFAMPNLFDKMWFSFEIGLIKPDPEIFRYVLKDQNLVPEETLFIDDTAEHVASAATLGIQAYHHTCAKDISELISQSQQDCACV